MASHEQKAIAVCETPQKAALIQRSTSLHCIPVMGTLRKLVIPRDARGTALIQQFLSEPPTWEWNSNEYSHFIAELAQALSSVPPPSILYLATDTDMVGEEIAWHVVEILKEMDYPHLSIKRVELADISDEFIHMAFDSAKDSLNIPRIRAGMVQKVARIVLNETLRNPSEPQRSPFPDAKIEDESLLSLASGILMASRALNQNEHGSLEQIEATVRSEETGQVFITSLVEIDETNKAYTPVLPIHELFRIAHWLPSWHYNKPERRPIDIPNQIPDTNNYLASTDKMSYERPMDKTQQHLWDTIVALVTSKNNNMDTFAGSYDALQAVASTKEIDHPAHSLLEATLEAHFGGWPSLEQLDDLASSIAYSVQSTWLRTNGEIINQATIQCSLHAWAYDPDATEVIPMNLSVFVQLIVATILIGTMTRSDIYQIIEHAKALLSGQDAYSPNILLVDTLPSSPQTTKQLLWEIPDPFTSHTRYLMAMEQLPDSAIAPIKVLRATIIGHTPTNKGISQDALIELLRQRGTMSTWSASRLAKRLLAERWMEPDPRGGWTLSQRGIETSSAIRSMGLGFLAESWHVEMNEQIARCMAGVSTPTEALTVLLTGVVSKMPAHTWMDDLV
jgi:hypothetical protein